MEQVILNLIRNSIDALEEKRKQGVEPGTEMSIHIQAKRQKESVVISIADNGIGISRQNIDYILQPFFTTKESGKGTGLGLSISSRIIKEMHEVNRRGEHLAKSSMMSSSLCRIKINVKLA